MSVGIFTSTTFTDGSLKMGMGYVLFEVEIEIYCVQFTIIYHSFSVCGVFSGIAINILISM
jgi:hypothetical protein